MNRQAGAGAGAGSVRRRPRCGGLLVRRRPRWGGLLVRQRYWAWIVTVAESAMAVPFNVPVITAVPAVLPAVSTAV